MTHAKKTKRELIAELAELRSRVAVLEVAEPHEGGPDARQDPGRVDGANVREQDRLQAILTTAIDCLPFDFFAVGNDGRCILLNAVARDHYGDVVGKRVEEAAPHEATLRLWQEIDQRAFAGEKVEGEARMYLHGEARDYYNIVTPIQDTTHFYGILGVSIDITKRKRAEEALRESEERYRQLVDSTTDAISILDENGTLLYANRTAGAYLGGNPESLVGKTQQDLFPPETIPEHLEYIRKVFATGQVVETEAWHHIGDRDLCWNVRMIPLRDEQGRITSVMAVCRDVTAQKRAEEALQRTNDELEQKVKERTAELAIFQRVIEASGLGFGLGDMDYRITYANPTLCRLFGEEKPEDVIGQPVFAYFTEEDREKLANDVAPFTIQEASWRGELTLLSRTGARIPTIQNAFLVRDEDGKPSRVAVAFVDISEQKKVEAALRASEERFALVVEGTGVGIWDWDIRTGKVYYSPRWKEIFGFGEHDVCESPEDFLRCLPPESFDMLKTLLGEVFSGASLKISGVEYPLRGEDGDRRWVEAYAVVVHDKDGQVCRVVGSNGDITARKLAEAALERERQALWQMLQASDHERQILSYEIHDGLAQYLAAAVMQFQSHDALRADSPNKAAKAYETAVELVRQAHSEARRLVSEVRPPVIDENGLETAISHLVHEQRRRGGPNIELHSNVQFGRLASILENALYRITQEALSNTIKYSQSQNVTVALIQEGQEVRLKVQDWGVGFDPESVGEGHFGLEGIRQRVRLVGGRLTIESTPGSGTLVEVAVPILERLTDGGPAG
jgi:PAS domain S-box-containing protein